MESFCGSWEAIDKPRPRKLAKPCSSATARRRCYAQFLNLEAEELLGEPRICSQAGSNARRHRRLGKASLKKATSSSTQVAALSPELWRNLDRLQEAELLTGSHLKAFPTCFESHHEEGGLISWKSAALILGVGAIAGAGGFAAAMATRPPPAGPDATPEAAPAAGASPDGAPPSATTAPDAGAPGVPPAAPPAPGAGLGVTVTPGDQESAESSAKLQQLLEIKAQREELEQRRKQVLDRREELTTETQPTLDEVDAQIKQLDVQEAEITGIEIDEAEETGFHSRAVQPCVE